MNRRILMRRELLLAILALMVASLAFAQASGSDTQDISMVLQNNRGPFVSADFAKQLGMLVMRQRYPGFVFTSSSPGVLDKGETWWVTFTVKDWPKNMTNLKPALSNHLTLWIRKRDAAILAIH